MDLHYYAGLLSFFSYKIAWESVSTLLLGRIFLLGHILQWLTSYKSYIFVSVN